MRDEHEPSDQAQMFKKAVERLKAIHARHVPEIVGDEHRDERQNAERAGGEPDKPSPQYEHGSSQLDNNRDRSPDPARMQAKMLLLCDRAAKVDQLVETADEKGAHQREPCKERSPGPFEDDVHPT